jgi:hypothetical protein
MEITSSKINYTFFGGGGGGGGWGFGGFILGKIIS